MKRKAVILVILPVLFISGCKEGVLPERKEINDLEMVQLVGIDRSAQDPNEVEITITGKKQKSSSGKDGESSTETFTISSSGPTIFEAERKFQSHSNKKLFWGHVDIFLFGEEAVKDDMAKYFDFILRDHEIRLTPKIYIVKGSPAKKMITAASSPDHFITDRLSAMDKDISTLSRTSDVELIEVAAMLANENTATVIPAIQMKEVNEEIYSQNEEKKDIESAGFAVIKDFKMVGMIDCDIALGYNIITNNVHSAYTTVKDPEGFFVSLEILNAKTKAKPHYNGDTLEGVTFETYIYSNITEQQSTAEIFTQDVLNGLAYQQSEIIENEMVKSIEKSKEYEIDCLGMSNRIKLKNPIRWEKMEKQWREIFPSLKIDVIVQSEIARTYDIRQSIGTKIE